MSDQYQNKYEFKLQANMLCDHFPFKQKHGNFVLQ